MSESLRNDGRVLPKHPGGPPRSDSERPRLFLGGCIHLRQHDARDIASRRAGTLQRGARRWSGGRSVYLDLTDAIKAEGKAIAAATT